MLTSLFTSSILSDKSILYLLILKIKTMAKKSKEDKTYLPLSGRVEHALQNMRFIDLQRALIIRGCAFEFVVSKSVGLMQSWLQEHWEDDIHLDRLDEFDEHKRKVLIKAGREDEPMIRLGLLGDPDKLSNIKIPNKIKIPKKPKIKRERDKDLGIYTGTKKAYTYELCHAGKSLEKTIERVIKKFPEAKDKSITIWYRKAQKLKK